MVELREMSGTNIIEFTVAETVTADDFDRVLPKYVEAAGKHMSLRILKIVRNMGGVDRSALNAKAGGIFELPRGVTHVALAADREWEPVVSQLGSIYPFQVKFFDLSQVDEARQWLKFAE